MAIILYKSQCSLITNGAHKTDYLLESLKSKNVMKLQRHKCLAFDFCGRKKKCVVFILNSIFCYFICYRKLLPQSQITNFSASIYERYKKKPKPKTKMKKQKLKKLLAIKYHFIWTLNVTCKIHNFCLASQSKKSICIIGCMTWKFQAKHDKYKKS